MQYQKADHHRKVACLLNDVGLGKAEGIATDCWQADVRQFHRYKGVNSINTEYGLNNWTK